MTDYTLYNNSLGIALTLMLFFACYFIVGKTPDKPIFYNYRRSRRLMGLALFALSANYSVHLFCGIRFFNQAAAILMNLSTYFLCYWLFSAALIDLLDHLYITRRRIIRNLVYWLALNVCAAITIFVLPKGIVANLAIIALAIWLLVYGIYLSRRIITTYRNAVRIFDDTHSENIAAYIRWMSIFTWWAVIYGVSCGLLTFLPDEYVFLWILSSIPFYIYLYCSYINYLLCYEQVESTLEISSANTPDDSPADALAATACDAEVLPSTQDDAQAAKAPVYFSNIDKNITEWLTTNRFTSPGITIEDLAVAFGTNRTYLSAYIKQQYGMSFREWIASLRIEYAKQLLTCNPHLTVSEVCEATGFLSQSYFVKIFTEKEGLSPSKWKKQK